MPKIFTAFRNINRHPRGGVALGLLLSAGCNTAATDVDETPRVRSLALTGDAGVDGGTGAPGQYLVGKYLGNDEVGVTTQIGVGLATEAAELASFDPGAAGIAAGGFQLPVAFARSVFVSDALAPEIVRYEVDAAGALAELGRLSFASAGLEFVTTYDVTVASDSQAYLFDPANFRAIQWDPATLQITGELDLTAGAKPGLTFAVGARDARVSGNLLYVPAYWFSEVDFSTLKTSAVIVIDLETGELSLAEDTRCATYSLVALPSGEIYTFPDGFFAQETYLDVPAPRAPTCSLRIDAGARTYSTDSAIDLGALVGGDEFIGGAVQGGIGDGIGGIYLGVGDEERYLAGESNVFRLWRWDLASNEATELTDTPLWNAYLSSFTTGSQVFAVLGADESSAVIELSKLPLAPFQLPGYIEVFARLTSLE